MTTRRKPYWCGVCKKTHRRNSMIGHEHEKFDGLFVKVTTFEHVRAAAPKETP